MNCPFRRSSPQSLWQKLKTLCKRPKGVLSSQNLAAILDTTVDSIITTNHNAIILAFNKAAENIFGYRKEEVIGKNVNILMTEPFRSQHDLFVQHYLRTGEKKIIGIGREVVAKRKDGSIFPIDLAVSEVKIGNDSLFTGIIRDLTVVKKTEASLDSYRNRENEIASQSEYISILSHELRTPVTAISASLSLLNGDKSISGKTHDLINIAFRNAERLAHIIDAVLDITKIQSGTAPLDLSSFSVMTLLKEAISLSKPLAALVKVELIPPPDTTPDVTIRSDYNKLIQVLTNLLTNAIKFSPLEGKILVSTGTKEGRLRISIQDFGKGIPAASQDKLFRPFSQTSRGDHIKTGSGLGLYICKLLIENLKGTIGFTTKENVGSTFFFEIPLEMV